MIVDEYDLDPAFIRGQGYHGAWNVSGKYRGCAALILNQVCLFLITPKRQAMLDKVIGRMPESSTHKTLIDQCRTPWVARHDSFHVFGKLYYEAIVDVLRR